MPRARKDPTTTAAADTSDPAMSVDDLDTPAAGTAGPVSGAATTPRARAGRTARKRDATPESPSDAPAESGGPSITETEPGHIQMVQASAADIRATTVEAHQSAAGRVHAGSVSLSQGASGFVRGGEARIEQGAVGALAADHVEFREGFALLVLARRVSGQVTVLLDWRGLVALVAVLLVLGRLLRGRG